MKKSTALIALLAAFMPLCAGTASAQETAEDFWAGASLEAAGFSQFGTSYGAGMSIGYGRGTAVGLKALLMAERDGLSSVELDFLLRFYAGGRNSSSGLFVQFQGGPVVFTPGYENFRLPAWSGSFSAGLCAGWRFFRGGGFFFEPAIRLGYPYLVGIGVSAGMAF